MRQLDRFFSCSAESFSKVQNWLTEVRQYARSEATYMIFGNKNDLEASGQRQVNLVDGAKFAQENGKCATLGLLIVLEHVQWMHMSHF